jgi:hypothetical protein
MQTKVLLGLFGVIIVILGVFLMNLLNFDETKVHVGKEYLSPLDTNKQEISFQEKTWAGELALSKSAQFTFPVNELFMQIDLKKYVPPKVKFFQLVVDKTDRYSLFCILQTLSSFNLPFVLEKEAKYPNVYVTSKTKEPLKKMIKRLKEYDIDSKIVEVWL